MGRCPGGGRSRAPPEIVGSHSNSEWVGELLAYNLQTPTIWVGKYK